MNLQTTGICPYCEKQRGKVGDLCPEQSCAKKGYHLIPEKWLESAKKMHIKKRLPFDPLLGRYIDRYLIAGKLGEGGMGKVYLAYQMPLERIVAIKIISIQRMDQSGIDRFKAEAKTLSILDHPNIVKIFDYGIEEGRGLPYMVLEYVKHGRTLRQRLFEVKKEYGYIPGSIILQIFEQILSGLGAAHAMGIIHRDMKPSNCLITKIHDNPFMVKILDFGLAKALNENGLADSSLHKDQESFLGTPLYMAPEQNPLNPGPIDARADLYAVAVMLYEIFTGVRPFEGKNIGEILRKKQDLSFRPLDAPEAASLPTALKDFLRKGLAPNPSDRYSSAKEMRDRLRTVLSDAHNFTVDLRGKDAGSSSEIGRWTPPSEPPQDNMSSKDGILKPRFYTLLPYITAPILGLLVVMFFYGIFRGDQHKSFQTQEVAVIEEKEEQVNFIVHEQDVIEAPQLGPTFQSFTISSEPSGALIKVDGIEVGRTPLTYEFAVSGAIEMQRLVEISATLPGYNRASRKVRLCDAVREGVMIELKKKGWEPPL